MLPEYKIISETNKHMHNAHTQKMKKTLVLESSQVNTDFISQVTDVFKLAVEDLRLLVEGGTGTVFLLNKQNKNRVCIRIEDIQTKNLKKSQFSTTNKDLLQL